MFENLKPLGDRVLVKRTAMQEKTDSGIFLPESAQEKQKSGVIIATGKGRYDNTGKLRPLDVKQGDSIIFGQYSGIEISEEYLIIREEDILGIID